MSRLLELPDAAYSELEELAAASGQTPHDWVVAQIRSAKPAADGLHPPAGTLAERFAGRVGVFASGHGHLSENTGERFTDILEEKRRAGRL